MSLSRELLQKLCTFGFEDLPDEVVDKAKRCILDAVGCAIGGAYTPSGQAAHQTTLELGGVPECTVIGSPIKTNCVQAAFANGAAINALDFDDIGPVGHVGAVVLPVALAIGERQSASGQEVIWSLVLGYEVVGRIAGAMRPSWERFQQMPWLRNTLTPAGAVTAGSLLRLPFEQFVHAFSISCAWMPIPSAASFEGVPLSWIKNNTAWSAAAAIQAALLAGRGFRGNETVLDSFWLKVGSDSWNPEALFDGLGVHWLILGTAFKHFPACYSFHNALTALTDLVAAHHLTQDAVDKVVVGGTWVFNRNFASQDPPTFIDAEFSLPYTVAMILRRTPPWAWFSRENLQDEHVRELSHRVTVVEDPAMQQRYLDQKSRGSHPAKVTVYTRDGTMLVGEATTPRGTPGFGDDWEALRGKFEGLANPYLDQARVQEIYQSIASLDHLSNVRDLTRLLRS
ncbi:MAG: MmgE/PrpD family protein [Chloroflexi bacterium]|nr:MmgE/PrpD family protein [Chloroflexota bacterium]